MNFDTIIAECKILVKQSFVNRDLGDQIPSSNDSFCGQFNDNKPPCVCDCVSVGLHID